MENVTEVRRDAVGLRAEALRRLLPAGIPVGQGAADTGPDPGQDERADADLGFPVRRARLAGAAVLRLRDAVPQIPQLRAAGRKAGRADQLAVGAKARRGADPTKRIRLDAALHLRVGQDAVPSAEQRADAMSESLTEKQPLEFP